MSIGLPQDGDQSLDARMRRVDDALTGSGLVSPAVVQDLVSLTTDSIIDYARRLSYREQVGIGEPRDRTKESWSSHQDDSAAHAERWAAGFGRDLKVVIAQSERESIKAVIQETVDELAGAKRSGRRLDIKLLVERCADQLALELTFLNRHRSSIAGNSRWWHVLAHRTARNVILPIATNRFMLVANAQRIDELVDDCVVAICHLPSTFEYRGRGQTVTYFLRNYWSYDGQSSNGKDTKPGGESASGHPNTLPRAISLESIPASDERHFLPVWDRCTVASSLELADDDDVSTFASPSGLELIWQALENALGRKSAACFYILTLLYYVEGLAWSKIATFLTTNRDSARILFEGRLPGGLTWTEFEGYLADTTITEINVRKLNSRGRRDCQKALASWDRDSDEAACRSLEGILGLKRERSED